MIRLSIGNYCHTVHSIYSSLIANDMLHSNFLLSGLMQDFIV